jgi:hypothetical protein
MLLAISATVSDTLRIPKRGHEAILLTSGIRMHCSSTSAACSLPEEAGGNFVKGRFVY